MVPDLTNHLILPTGGYVSAQVTIADLDGDGQLEIIAGSDALYVWRLDPVIVWISCPGSQFLRLTSGGR
jgi:hypothetical protein